MGKSASQKEPHWPIPRTLHGRVMDVAAAWVSLRKIPRGSGTGGELENSFWALKGPSGPAGPTAQRSDEAVVAGDRIFGK